MALCAAVFGFGILGFIGHSAAWAAAALSFFAAIMVIVINMMDENSEQDGMKVFQVYHIDREDVKFCESVGIAIGKL